jgi:error-prone DNA polymerase
LARRVPELNRKELVALAQIGALNSLGEVEHRRDALWHVEWAGRPVGPLLRGAEAGRGEPQAGQSASQRVSMSASPTLRCAKDGAPAEQRDATAESSEKNSGGGATAPDRVAAMPLRQMTTEERLEADYTGTGLTTGPHPMAYHRDELRAEGIFSARELEALRSGRRVAIAGCVIARQRPGTAKGFVFLSLEDETGIANVILTPDVFERDRLVVTRNRFLRIEGPVQNQEGVIHVKAQRIVPLEVTRVEVRSRDFH